MVLSNEINTIESENIEKIRIRQLISNCIKHVKKCQENKGAFTGIPTGYRGLDVLTSGFQKSNLIVLSARPMMGKTSLALNISRNIAVNLGTPVAIFSLDLTKEQLSMRMLCSEARTDCSRLRRGFLKEGDWKKLTEASEVLSEAPIYIDDAHGNSIEEIISKAQKMIKEQDVGIIFIDCFQLIMCSHIGDDRKIELTAIVRSLKSFAEDCNIPVVVLSTASEMVEFRRDKRPMLSDLDEYGALDKYADMVLFIYRDELYDRRKDNPCIGTAEIILAKQRYGPKGCASLKFTDDLTRFDEPFQ